MTHTSDRLPELPSEHPYRAQIDSERTGWYELAGLVRNLSPEESVLPGYYKNPDWSVRDVVAHIGTWLAQAEVQLERLRAGTYEGHDIDIDALNDEMLDLMSDQPWSVAWVQANAGRTLMLQDFYALNKPDAEAAWWVEKSGGAHYAEHLPRLRDWVAELIARREI
ncbi:MAG: hypothetical protein QOJ81_213 [Chloroflexota bacterium]|nr:hypothetical protein [Chloroflexota bacterium]